MAVGIWCHWRFKNRKLISMASKIPGPPVVPLFGNALMFMAKPEEMISIIEKILQDYAGTLKFWLGPDLNIIVSNPEDIKTLLTSPKTSKKGPQYKYMADILGGGILSGSETIMGLSKDESVVIPHLQEIIDVSPSMYKIIFERMTKWYLQIDPVFWLTESYRTQRRFIKIISDFGQYVIDARRSRLAAMNIDKRLLHSKEEKTTDLSIIDRFILSEELSTVELINEIMTLFTASQEASGKICSYLLLMLAYHPQYQEKLYSEINKVIGDETRAVTENDFKQMPYLDMVYKEVVRLFPIGAMIQRTVREDIEISTCTLPKGSSLVIPIYHIQRDKRFWVNPNDFDPERFSPENSRLRHPCCYIPFSLGPMDCLGRYFGTKLIKTIAVKVIQEYSLTSLSSYKDLRLAIRISVFSLNGYPVILTPRKESTT
ncbi:unnamed protein product [Leptosia nina]|uniref:Cytochrome P450 n=1 Tax=Leptosia nina TaxID=320188 RepID=A0AAV1IWZ9_9NEOP